MHSSEIKYKSDYSPFDGADIGVFTKMFHFSTAVRRPRPLGGLGRVPWRVSGPETGQREAFDSVEALLAACNVVMSSVGRRARDDGADDSE